MTNWTEIDQCARAWLKEAGDKIILSFQTALQIKEKTNANDLVTNIDQETERFFAKQIRQTFPGHRIMGEEGFGDDLKDLSGVVWIVDPIDGTTNFIHQKRNFMISIGIFENGESRLGYIYDVVLNEIYVAVAGEGAYWNDEQLPMLKETTVDKAVIGINLTWLTSNRLLDPAKTLIPLANDVRGTRSYGSAAMEFAYVSTGRLDAYITMRLSPWDFAGGKIILEEVGGKITNLKGEPLNLLEKTPVVAAKPRLHEKIIEEYLKKGIQ
ncbi:inositol monophosphatase family protein [Siminovitchia sp. FSL H7-0308]|uniref:inositol-phosphate phosphatase n=1 Tax=Siminovitchia thermophila TaxID=1245522 RepID=A0ABS2RDU5_9BACI|nr:inositol monophosphatase family protein [Siminovitchia thermophila]MBM7716761.1 myo-inositol-1(or 4)-monophosphatase [Siminovitchia thermophila]ONK23711.1 inositol monophosphatase [Bacillus sp. VT-16-64]